MSSITIYGASDDLVEVEGDIVEEFNPYSDDEPSYLAASDGTFLRISYDGLWHIVPIRSGEETTIEIKTATDEDKNYSDRVTLTNPRGFEFVLFGHGMAKAKGARLE